jgi:hypothetical protein
MVTAILLANGDGHFVCNCDGHFVCSVFKNTVVLQYKLCVRLILMSFYFN